MAKRLFIAVAKNDIRTFRGLVQEKRSLLQERLAASQNTILHLAAKCGHVELVAEIIRFCPEMVAAENVNGETPLYEACRKGKAEAVMLLLENNPWVASTLNKDNQSAFSIACSQGHLDVVKLILNQTWLMDIEEDRVELTCMREVISRGHTSIVKTLLEARPGFARKIDRDGNLPLHYACEKGQLEMVRVFLQFGEDLAQQFNNYGYTPLHYAAMNGDAAILLEFMSKAPTAFKLPTRDGETVFHLAVKSSKSDAFISMAKIFKNTNLLHQTDQSGNTVLHLAVCYGYYNLAEYIINETKVDINHRNHQGNTAVDLLNQAEVSSETDHITDMLLKSGGKRGIEMQSLAPNAQNLTPESFRDELEQQFEMLPGSIIDSANVVCNNIPNDHPIVLDVETNPEGKFTVLDDTHKKRSPVNKTALHVHKRQSQRRRKELCELHKSRRNKQYEAYREGLANARNTIILVAILIATVTFTVGLNPPGGAYQDRDQKGQSTVGRKLAFKIFVISNTIALFTSLCIVIVLVSIIPFQRKKLMKLMTITHKIMWVAVSFMAAPYVAATWVILPHVHGIRWMFEAVLAIAGGTMVTVFVYLGVQLVRHWIRKSKWKKGRGEKGKIAAFDLENGSEQSKSAIEGEIKLQEFNNGSEIQSESTNSDVDSSKSFGYHTY